MNEFSKASADASIRVDPNTDRIAIFRRMKAEAGKDRKLLKGEGELTTVVDAAIYILDRQLERVIDEAAADPDSI